MPQDASASRSRVQPHRAVRGEHELVPPGPPGWRARRGSGVRECRARTARSRAASCPAGTPGRRRGWAPRPDASVCRCRCSAIRVIVLPRPMSSARQPPRPSEVIRPATAGRAAGSRAGRGAARRAARCPAPCPRGPRAVPQRRQPPTWAVRRPGGRRPPWSPSARRRARRSGVTLRSCFSRARRTSWGSTSTHWSRSRTTGRFASASRSSSGGELLVAQCEPPVEGEQRVGGEERRGVRAGRPVRARRGRPAGR
jgi:hypothetical protein